MSNGFKKKAQLIPPAGVQSNARREAAQKRATAERADRIAESLR